MEDTNNKQTNEQTNNNTKTDNLTTIPFFYVISIYVTPTAAI